MNRWIPTRWSRWKRTGPPDESTLDRQRLLKQERQKLRRAETLAAELQAHDRVNNYAARLRRAYALAEGGKAR